MRRLVAVLLLIVGLAVVAAGGWLAYEWYTPYQGYRGSAVIDVPKGATSQQIAGLLARKGAVQSALAFEIWSRWHHGRNLEAGEYHFDHPMTPREVFNQVAEGRIWTVSLTVPEGWTMFDIADAVARAGLASRAAFLQAARNPAPIRQLAPNVPTLEGFLFPATYDVPHRTTAKAIVDMMVRRFRQAWAKATQKDPKPKNMSLEQVVTLASLVQEETPEEKERPIIAGVFMNRLRLGFPLQCDPTVIYALKLAGHYDGQLQPAELRIRSPYNTYLHYGLPPGPIGNPGIASLEAALAPAHVDYLYFVANGKGGHAFSRTLAGQERNVERYREFLQREKEKQEQKEKKGGGLLSQSKTSRTSRANRSQR
jgi:UPF0755 protein